MKPTKQQIINRQKALAKAKKKGWISKKMSGELTLDVFEQQKIKVLDDLHCVTDPDYDPFKNVYERDPDEIIFINKLEELIRSINKIRVGLPTDNRWEYDFVGWAEQLTGIKPPAPFNENAVYKRLKWEREHGGY